MGKMPIDWVPIAYFLLENEKNKRFSVTQTALYYMAQSLCFSGFHDLFVALRSGLSVVWNCSASEKWETSLGITRYLLIKSAARLLATS